MILGIFEITKLDKGKNQCIRQKTGAQNTVNEIKQYQKKWLQHVQRMDTNRLPKQALQYKPKGQRSIGRPRKRWRDQLHLEEHDDDDDILETELYMFRTVSLSIIRSLVLYTQQYIEFMLTAC